MGHSPRCRVPRGPPVPRGAGRSLWPGGSARPWRPSRQPAFLNGRDSDPVEMPPGSASAANEKCKLIPRLLQVGYLGGECQRDEVGQLVAQDQTSDPGPSPLVSPCPVLCSFLGCGGTTGAINTRSVRM